MIDKQYFRRQATTLRAMIRVTKSVPVVSRLSDLAADFEQRADDGSPELEHQAGPPRSRVEGEQSHGPEN